MLFTGSDSKWTAAQEAAELAAKVPAKLSPLLSQKMVQMHYGKAALYCSSTRRFEADTEQLCCHS